MRIRNRAIRVGETFYPFKRLPLEIQTWSTAGSGSAALPFYPLCFASKTQEPKTRFNLSIDTLYFDGCFEDLVGADPHIYSRPGKCLFSFLEYISPVEMDGFKNITIADSAGLYIDRYDLSGYEYWKKLGDFVGKCTGLKNILTVHEVSRALTFFAGNLRASRGGALQSHNLEESLLGTAYGWRDEGYVELSDDFPDELVHRFELTAEELGAFPLGHMSNHQDRDNDWVDKRTRPVWGCRRARTRLTVL
ncbi:uncharacterized protein PAC_07062 [Phialocephala subalpina]|uniref:Uncharacterized protein n=1 Tax=Phialocephala subalpina TaxID=576137 RepID=A0A1L7WWP2_9HELO|nr:uncharacterized protein PAC_07062 [Phialocephala subalpina]